MLRRLFHLATSDYVTINSLCRNLKAGANDLTYADAINLSETLAKHAGKGRTARIRLQYSRILWNLWHGPYDKLPPWLA